MRRIMHVDMNSFFASCECAINNDLIGKNIAVAGDPKKRSGIILAASYEAKQYGIKTTMPIWKAVDLCKDLIILPCNMELYVDFSKKFERILERYAPVIEKASIDEAYLDFTGTENMYPSMLELAKEIQQVILKELNLKCSIGISENKLLAKMGSDYKKPLGITEIYVNDVKNKLWPLKANELIGIGKSTYDSLKSIGIYTIGELANYDIDTLKLYFGAKSAEYLINAANGFDDSEVIPNGQVEAKSSGIERTYIEDVYDKNEIFKTLSVFSEELSFRLRNDHKKCKTITLKIKYANFTSIAKSHTLDSYENITQTIYEVSKMLFEKSVNLSLGIRLVGLSCSNLINEEDEVVQLTLLDDEQYEKALMKEKMTKAEKAMDVLRNKYGTDIIKRAKNLGMSVYHHDESSE